MIFYRSDDPTNSVKAMKENKNTHTINTNTYKKTQKIPKTNIHCASKNAPTLKRYRSEL